MAEINRRSASDTAFEELGLLNYDQFAQYERPALDPDRMYTAEELMAHGIVDPREYALRFTEDSDEVTRFGNPYSRE